jgi:hypothetical protein
VTVVAFIHAVVVLHPRASITAPAGEVTALKAELIGALKSLEPQVTRMAE